MPLLRFATRDHFSWVMPIVTLVDEGERIVTWQPGGSSMMRHTGEKGGPRGRNLVGWDGGHESAIWTGSGVIRAHRFGDPWSVWRWENGDAWHPGCYVNLEGPWRRTELGFDSGDWILDLVIDGEGAVTRKDEDELADALKRGGVTAEEVATIEAAADAATAAHAAGAWPFSADWDAWLPLRTTDPLTVPEGWDARFEAGPGRE